MGYTSSGIFQMVGTGFVLVFGWSMATLLFVRRVIGKNRHLQEPSFD
jgi:hypothetical protein